MTPGHRHTHDPSSISVLRTQDARGDDPTVDLDHDQIRATIRIRGSDVGQVRIEFGIERFTPPLGQPSKHQLPKTFLVRMHEVANHRHNPLARNQIAKDMSTTHHPQTQPTASTAEPREHWFTTVSDDLTIVQGTAERVIRYACTILDALTPTTG